MNADKGFTLIELLVTLAVAVIVLMVAVPNFRAFVQQNRLATTTNTIVTALNLTRSEAVRRGARVTLCKSADGQTCTSSGNWDQGWIVFSDPDSNGEVGGASIIRMHAGLHADQTLTGSSDVAGYISYAASGQSRMLNDSFQAGTLTLCERGGIGRSIILSAGGRVRTEEGDASCNG